MALSPRVKSPHPCLIYLRPYLTSSRRLVIARPQANVNISAPIMSRFDLFFVILDECNPVTDEAIARHIIDVHREGGGAHLKAVTEDVPFSTDKLRRYIRFARTLNPTLPKDSQKVLTHTSYYPLFCKHTVLPHLTTATTFPH